MEHDAQLHSLAQHRSRKGRERRIKRIRALVSPMRSVPQWLVVTTMICMSIFASLVVVGAFGILYLRSQMPELINSQIGTKNELQALAVGVADKHLRLAINSDDPQEQQAVRQLFFDRFGAGIDRKIDAFEIGNDPELKAQARQVFLERFGAGVDRLIDEKGESLLTGSQSDLESKRILLTPAAGALAESVSRLNLEQIISTSVDDPGAKRILLTPAAEAFADQVRTLDINLLIQTLLSQVDVKRVSDALISRLESGEPLSLTVNLDPSPDSPTPLFSNTQLLNSPRS